MLSASIKSFFTAPHTFLRRAEKTQIARKFRNFASAKFTASATKKRPTNSREFAVFLLFANIVCVAPVFATPDSAPPVNSTAKQNVAKSAENLPNKASANSARPQIDANSADAKARNESNLPNATKSASQNQSPARTNAISSTPEKRTKSEASSKNKIPAINAKKSRELAAPVAQSLRKSGVWIDPTLRASVNDSAISNAIGAANFPVRVLVLRRLHAPFHSIDEIARVVDEMLRASDEGFARGGLTIVSTRDDAQLAVLGGDLDAETRAQIVARGAQTWTQEGEAGGVAQTLRLVSAERATRHQSRFWRMTLLFGTLFTLTGGALWLRISRNRKRSMWRAISQSIVVPSELSDEFSRENSAPISSDQSENSVEKVLNHNAPNTPA